jgi:hypothetical protein
MRLWGGVWGQTSRMIEIRCQKPRRNLWHGESEKSALTEHINTRHEFQLEISHRLSRTVTYMDHLVREAVEMQLHLKNCNREAGFTLRKAWCHIIVWLRWCSVSSTGWVQLHIGQHGVKWSSLVPWKWGQGHYLNHWNIFPLWCICQPKKTVIEFYCHKTSKHVSDDVLDSEEGHQQPPPDQTYDIICHMAYDSMGMFELSLRVASTELSDWVR